MKINISKERIQSACNTAVSYLNDLIVFNSNQSNVIRLEWQEIQKRPIDIIRDCEEQRQMYYLIQTKIKENKELTEEDFNQIKRYL